MTYKDALKQAMQDLAKDERTVFIGYNIRFGSKAYGTLEGVSEDQCIETPVAENLMAGLAIGMALEGFRPVLYFERHDFILNALDALANHLDKLETMSEGVFKAPVVVRAVVGGTTPFYPGPQHTQDFSSLFQDMFHFPVVELVKPGQILEAYRDASMADHPTMMIERRDWYVRS